MMTNEHRSHRHKTKPVVNPPKRVMIGEMLDDLDERLSHLRREIAVHPLPPPTVSNIKKT